MHNSCWVNLNDQVKLEVVDEVLVEVVALVVVAEVGVHYFFGRVGGCVWWD